MEDRAQTYLPMGYDRLLGYFGPGGGLTYWCTRMRPLTQHLPLMLWR